MTAAHYLDDALAQLRKYKALGDAAVAQVSAAQLFEAPGPESNAMAVTLKHMAGNMRSRWTDFLTTDGEKPDRERDREFVIDEGDTHESIVAGWEAGWRCVLDAVSALAPADLEKVVHIRGEAHTVLQAISRQLTHYAYHVGQIVFLARHLAGDGWRSLSIPKGRSRDFDVSKDGGVYDVEGGKPA